MVPPETWEMTIPEGLDSERPITAQQRAARIQEALQQKVAPATGASFGALAVAVSSTDKRLDVLQAETRNLKFRAAWTEKAILSSQIEQAKRTIVCRIFPEWLTLVDRELTVKHAFTQVGLRIEVGPHFWELTTWKMTGDDGKEFLFAVSIRTVPNLNNRIRPRYAQMKKKQEPAPEEKGPWDDWQPLHLGRSHSHHS